MGDLAGKTILITGANTGIGRATALALGARGAALVLACRSAARTQPVIDALRAQGSTAEFLELDLGDLASVRRCAEAVLDRAARLDVLLNNAGLAGQRGRTKDGFELAFGVNHLGHFLLTELLLDRLIASAPSRVVNVSSLSHYSAKSIDWEALRKPTASITGLPEYGVSKLCNVLHAKELASRLEGRGVTTYALHPGTIASDVWRRVPWPARPLLKLFLKSTAQGALTSIHCAASPEVAAESGLYYDDCQVKRPNRLARDLDLAVELRERSKAWTGL